MIFMGTSVDPEFIPEIMETFDITERPRIIQDGSYHYMSYEERMQKRDKRRKIIKKARRNGLL